MRAQYGLGVRGLDLGSLVSTARQEAEKAYDRAKGYLEDTREKVETEIREEVKDIAREAGDEAGASAGTSFKRSFLPWIVGGAGILLIGLTVLPGQKR